MRNEILGIFLFFLVIFTLISLLTYSPADPSIHHVGTSGGVDNFFGLIGAYLSGILIGLFGVGAFWIPVLLLLASIQSFKDRSPRALMLIGGGGLMLVVVTGGLFAIYGDSYEVLGSTYTAGGMIGHPLRTLLLTYSNATGGTAILLVFFIIGFTLTTGVSFVAVLKNCVEKRSSQKGATGKEGATKRNSRCRGYNNQGGAVYQGEKTSSAGTETA